ncbi:MAG: discoidin domain-containing protein, partial [Candidatus Hodarchaeales archaeon]
MSYNFLRNARSITNSSLCRNDTLNGYQTDLTLNGDFDGWDVYEHVYLYGSWNGVLFGTANTTDCYIGRTLSIAPVIEAEKYYVVKLMMKITSNDSRSGLTNGRIRWTTTNDGTWTATKQENFTIIADDKWHLYQINMGPKQYWQGNINNFRIYPFTDGWAGDEFAIKFLKVSSVEDWICTNTSCSYYTRYEHPCPGAGRRASREAGETKAYYTTISGVTDKLIVNIDGYGDEEFELGTNQNLSGVEMARVVTNTLSILNIGSYAFAEAEYSENDKIKITSGSTGSDSSVVVRYSTAAEALGFYDGVNNISTSELGQDQATGFDYAASRILRPFEINKMLDGLTTEQSYIHNPVQFSVEGGRSDFAEIGNSRSISNLVGSPYYESLNNKGRTIIDVSHPINNNGRIKAIYIYGRIDDDTVAKVKICRPLKNGTLRVIHSLSFDSKTDGVLYTKRQVSHRIDCDILVNKGDLIGIYNADLYVGVSITGLPDAMFYQYDGESSGTFDPGRVYAFGVAGLAVYARGDRRQTNAILDIDMGERINVEQVNIYGEEESGYFDFNLASCLDVSWSVNLFGESHIHSGNNLWTGEGFNHTHTNIAYGEETLEDMIRTPDGGQVGDSYYTDNGLGTTGTHTYFYVNGDGEWIYSGDANEPAEYHWPLVPTGKHGFVRDPIAFSLLFPSEYESKIHKSIIYFKERNNFRNFALSYYLGTNDATGDADDPNFRYIPRYNSIRLDGLLFDETNNESMSDYLFVNPTSEDAVYIGGQITNEDAVSAAHSTFWYTLEHNFNPINCKGFRVYCDKHNSTKIMEMEVYSRVKTDPALVDNVTMSFSDYGVVWKTVGFEELEEGKIGSFIGGAPQYFEIELESSTEFNINEIELLVGDQVKLPTCEASVFLDNAKTNATNVSTPLVLENNYDKPFDLLVDVPHEASKIDNLLFWSKLGSYTDIENPDRGPACFLQKEENYTLLNANGQCAINVPTYGLKNAIHNKEAYYSYNDEDYISWGTLASGSSIDFCNTAYKSMRTSEISFPGVSSRYWKIGIVDSSAAVSVKDIMAYYNDVRVPLVTTYSGSTLGISSQLNATTSDGTNMQVTPVIDDNEAFGFAFATFESVDKIKLIHGNATINSVNIYTSPDNGNNYILTGSGVVSPSNQSIYVRFAIDLERRHNIDIMRNYGTATSKITLDKETDVEYSNTETSNIDNVVWDNTTYADARWARIKVLCDDGTIRCIRKLGIYPDIEQNWTLDGQYNCEWQSLGRVLTDYDVPINVAYGATVTGTNYYFSEWYPTNAVDGAHDQYEALACWGFQKEPGAVDPYLEIDFGQTYSISKVILYHGYHPDVDDYMNTDYTFSVSTTTTGSFSTVFSVSSNSEHERTHQFNAVSARRVRLTITGYDYGDTLSTFDPDTNQYEIFKGSFLREAEVYTHTSAGYVNSEEWPVVCLNLRDTFNVINHELVNKDINDTTTDWDNDDQFFTYSSDHFDDPQKVIFRPNQSVQQVYSSTDSSGNMKNISLEYVFESSLFLSQGWY